MNNLQSFNNSLFGEVRFVEVDGKPYAVANDVAKALGYKRPNDAVNAHCKGVLKHRTITNGGRQELNIIPKSDICRLIQKSKVKNYEYKKTFEEWLTSFGLIEENKFIIESRKEIEFGYLLIEALKPFNLSIQTQVVDNKYRLDFLIPELNIVIEYDENNHINYDQEKEQERESYINNNYSKLIRVSDKNTDAYNVGVIIKEIYSIKADTNIKKSLIYNSTM